MYFLDISKATVFICTVVLLQLIYLTSKWYLTRHQRLPGPIPWPIIGNSPLLGKNPHITLTKWSKIYGDVFQMKLGSRPVVVFNGRKAITDLLGGNKPEFSARPELESAKYVNRGKCAVFARVPPEENRYHKKVLTDCVNNLVLTRNEKVKKDQLKQNGLSNYENKSRLSVVEELLIPRCKPFVERLLKLSEEERNGTLPKSDDYVTGGRYSPIFAEMNFEMCLVFHRLVFDDTSDDHRKYIRQHISLTDEFGKIIGSANIYDVMPWLGYIFPKYLDRFKTVVDISYVMFREQLAKRSPRFYKMVKESSSLNDIHPTTFADTLLKECEKHKNTKDYDRDIILNLGCDFLGAALDTAPKGFEWVVIYAAMFPDIQDKIRHEIDEFVRENKALPLYEHRSKLPRTWSFILEVFRYTTFLPLTVPHAPIKDGLKINNRIVPGDCLIFVNQWSANHDPKLWSTPGHFRPERFLDEEGFLKHKLENQILLFGIGRRKCPGKIIAEMEIFHLLVAIIYRAHIRPGPKMVGVPNYKFGLVLMAEEGNVEIVRRENIPLEM